MNACKLFLRAILVLACLNFFAVASRAQFRAGVEGTVSDTSGGVLNGAQVTVTSQETQKSEVATASDSGFYSVTNLPPGLYTISATLTGFKTRVLKDVPISAEKVSGINLVLSAGAVTDQVVVNGDAAGQLQTEDASLTGTITNEQVQNLPQFRGDPYELLRLTPGVFGEGARSSGGDSVNLPGYSGVGGSNRGVFQVENAVQVSANGSRVEANGYQIDGISTNSQAWGGATVLTPNQESVKEIKVEVSPYSAENSHGAGAIVEVVSQNGTNDFHGSAVLRLHSPGLNAYQRPAGTVTSPQRDNLLLHDYLGSLGGPILKNKLFAFFSFEHIKTSGGNYRASSWVETSQWVGNLPAGTLAAKAFAVPGSGFLNPKILPSTCAGLGLTVGPTCAQVAGGVDLGSNTTNPADFCKDASNNPIPGLVCNPRGGGLDGIPDVALVEYDAKNDNFKSTQFNGRVDFNVTQKDLVAFSLFMAPHSNTFLPGGWVDGRQYNTFNSDGTNETAALLWTRTINTTTINEARMNVTRWYFDEIKSNPQAPFGVPNINLAIPQNTITAGFALGPGVFYQTTYAFRDTLSKVHNSHVLKFGAEVAREQNNSSNTWGARPTYDFNNLWSFANDKPIDQGTGTFDPKTGVPTDFRKYIRVSAYGFFVQDSWKAKPNLTLTMGLRYDYFSPMREKFGRLSNIVLGTGANALTGARIKTGGDFTNPDRNNFGPQLGFAWSPRSIMSHEFNNRFVLRGGVGVAYNRVPESLLLQAAGNPPDFIATSFPTSEVVYGFSSGGIRSFSGFPANPAAILTFDPNTGLPIGGEHLAKPDIKGPVQNMATPYTWHYSLEGQYDVGRNWIVALSYQGSQSRKYPRTINDALIFPQNPNINSVKIFQTDVNANYNAILARVTHHSSKGLDLGASYRHSRTMDFCSSDQECHQTYPTNQKLEYAPSDFDVAHNFTANALYELPFFRNRHDWLYTVAGGWKLGGIFTFNTGFPWTPTVRPANGDCGPLTNAGLICPIRPTAYLGGAGSDSSTSTFLKPNGNFPGNTLITGGSKYFTFSLPPTSGLPPPPGIGRNSFRGPRYTGFDLSFGKRFTLPKVRFLGENAGFEIKANAFNIFNKVNLGGFNFNSDSTTINNARFGQASTEFGGRVIELYGRFSF